MKRVVPVATISPPITARPRGAFCSPPSPRARAIGIIPKIMAIAVMKPDEDGFFQPRSPPRSGRDFFRFGVRWQRQQEGWNLRRQSHGHDGPHERLDIEGCTGKGKHPEDADQRAGNGSHNNERVKPGLKQTSPLKGKRESREDDSETELVERFLHNIILTANMDENAFWKRLKLGRELA